MQKARRQGLEASFQKPLRQLVGIRFQVLFHSPPGVLFTFPSRYLFTIGHQGVFSLGRWASRIHTRFPVPRATWELNSGRLNPFAYRTIAFFGGWFHTLQLGSSFVTSRQVRNPAQLSPATPAPQRLRALT